MRKGAKFGIGVVLGAVVVASALGTAACTTSSGNDTEKTEGNQGDAVVPVSETLEDADYTVSYDDIVTASNNYGGASVHDPSIIKADDSYYIFGSHMEAAVSTDLHTWSRISSGYTAGNEIFTDIAEDSDAFYFTGSINSIIPVDSGNNEYREWAPDVKYNETLGKYVMYYCTSSTYCSSTICYATSDTIDGAYEWQGNLIYSGITEDNLQYTDITDYVTEEYALENYVQDSGKYNNLEYPNAIDPTVFTDKDGKLWMVYGSWSGGIFLLEIDESTGKVIHPEADPDNAVDAYYGKRLLGGNHMSGEGPYIIYDDDTGYYYLYISYGSLTWDGGYQIRVFRSESVDGDYVDMNGAKTDITMTGNTQYGLKMSGNYILPSLKYAYMATGHNSVFEDTDGKKYVVYHTRFRDVDNNSDLGGVHFPRVKQYFYNEEGWPCMLPYATSGETISETGYSMDEVVGRYYVTNSGNDVSAKIPEVFILYLTEKGNVFGDGITGTWSMKDGSYYMTITYDKVTYSGVFCQMKDEAGTEVMTFSAVGTGTILNGGSTIWGVKYDEE